MQFCCCWELNLELHIYIKHAIVVVPSPPQSPKILFFPLNIFDPGLAESTDVKVAEVMVGVQFCDSPYILRSHIDEQLHFNLVHAMVSF